MSYQQLWLNWLTLKTINNNNKSIHTGIFPDKLKIAKVIPLFLKNGRIIGLYALHCTGLHCTALHCPALHCTALHCTALHCTALHCNALHYTTLH